jgi:hypothetical protein
MSSRRRLSWLYRVMTPTASQVLAALIVLAIVSAWGRTRDAVIQSVQWLAHPMPTPRAVFVLVLVLAASAGIILLAALWNRVVASRKRDTPGHAAEAFRSDWENLADTLRSWRNQGLTSDGDNLNQERYRDLRREVSKSYSQVREHFIQFLNENREWDLREPLDPELTVPVVYEGIDFPFRELWFPDNLPRAMRTLRAN